MRINRLIELLRAFTPDEHKRLRLFIASPYYVQGKRAESLPALLETALVSVESPPETWPDTTAVYAPLFPEEPFVQGKLDKYVRSLYQSALQFLSIECLTAPDNAPDHQMALAATFQRRDMLDHSATALKTARKLLDEPQRKNEVYYQRRYLLALHEADQRFLKPSKGTHSLDQLEADLQCARPHLPLPGWQYPAGRGHSSPNSGRALSGGIRLAAAQGCGNRTN